MLLSLALVFLCAMFLGWAMQRLHLPALLGMLLTGVLLGPYVTNLLDSSLLGISAQLRQIALIIVLTRAGLSMDFAALRRVGRPAILLCFVPACFEIAGTVLLAPPLLGLSRVERAVLGAVIAAVSPAVVVPKMLRLTEERLGTDKGIPQLIMAGASVDDVFVIVLFTAFTDIAAGQNFSAGQFLRIPTSLVLGVAAGVVCGALLAAFFGFGAVGALVFFRTGGRVVFFPVVVLLFLAQRAGIVAVVVTDMEKFVKTAPEDKVFIHVDAADVTFAAVDFLRHVKAVQNLVIRRGDGQAKVFKAVHI